MKKSQLLLLMGSIVLVRCIGATPPAEQEIKGLQRIFDRGSSFAYELEVAFIDKESNFDPIPQDAASFRQAAMVVARIKSVYVHDYLIKVLEEAEKVKWVSIEGKGSPTAVWAIVGPEGKRYLELLVEESHSLIGYRGVWYKFDGSLARLVSVEALKFVRDAFDDRISGKAPLTNQPRIP
jgi:hypothetical protein